MDIDGAVEMHQDRLMAIPGVTGIGIGENAGRPVIVVMVATLTPEVRAQVPSQLEGFEVQLETSGDIRPL